jgi:hypothetical protein
VPDPVQVPEVVREPERAMVSTGSPGDAIQSFQQLELGMERARNIANRLSHLVKEKHLAVQIGQGEHLKVEAWCALGAMVGVSPMTEWTRQVAGADVPAYEARVTAVRIATGQVICAAEADCWSDEYKSLRDGGFRHNWVPGCPVHETHPKTPCEYAPTRHALRSMAQTRAVSKALGQALRWIVVLAGYSGTPAEEMTFKDDGAEKPKPASFERGAAQARAKQEAAAQAGKPAQAPATRDEWDNSTAGPPPAPGPARSADAISEGKQRRAWALANKRAGELGGDWTADALLLRLCRALSVSEVGEIHWRNFGNQKQPERYPDWIELFLETWEPPEEPAAPQEQEPGPQDEAFVDGAVPQGARRSTARAPDDRDEPPPLEDADQRGGYGE